jgi:hypothetical protein
LQCLLLQVDVAEIVLHEPYDPDAVIDLLDADALTGQNSAGVFMANASCGRSVLNSLRKASKLACCCRLFIPGGRVAYFFKVLMHQHNGGVAPKKKQG